MHVNILSPHKLLWLRSYGCVLARVSLDIQLNSYLSLTLHLSDVCEDLCAVLMQFLKTSFYPGKKIFSSTVFLEMGLR